MHWRYGDLDYPQLTKVSFLLGITLFMMGELGEFGIRQTGISIPGWEHTLLVTMAAIGVIIALLSPFVFGIVLPMTE